MTKRQWRDLCVRAIEDAIVLFCIGVGIAVVCTVVGGVFRLFGVA